MRHVKREKLLANKMSCVQIQVKLFVFQVSYTHLVIATGSWSPFPASPTAVNPKVTKEEGMKLYSGFYDEVRGISKIYFGSLANKFLYFSRPT